MKYQERASVCAGPGTPPPAPTHSLRDTLRSELVHVKQPVTDSPSFSVRCKFLVVHGDPLRNNGGIRDRGSSQVPTAAQVLVQALVISHQVIVTSSWLVYLLVPSNLCSSFRMQQFLPT
ncbi:unnamed protein product [Pleuronectes platessa]|uniref:Uncharacterized protein n=1 Tax=Pleuronectes platessa TaxID=8262 RepID=A0A9N7Z4I6_PLEPL|nr:unnamed protein product [Pleuronectes platessa]